MTMTMTMTKNKIQNRFLNVPKYDNDKEYVERRHGEPFEFVFLPKMDLLDSQASTKKKKSNYEL
jgi:hypothetical protein